MVTVAGFLNHQQFGSPVLEARRKCWGTLTPMASILKKGYRENELEYCKNVIKVFFLSLCPKKHHHHHHFQWALYDSCAFFPRGFIYTTNQPQRVNKSPVLAFKGATMQLSPGLAVFGTPWDDLDDLTSPVLHLKDAILDPSYWYQWVKMFFFHQGYGGLVIWIWHWHVEFPRYGGLLERWCSFSHCLNGVFRWTMFSFRGVRL